jgi:hypothetical protein
MINYFILFMLFRRFIVICKQIKIYVQESRILTPKQVGPKTGRCILIRNRDYYFYKGYI